MASNSILLIIISIACLSIVFALPIEISMDGPDNNINAGSKVDVDIIIGNSVDKITKDQIKIHKVNTELYGDAKFTQPPESISINDFLVSENEYNRKYHFNFLAPNNAGQYAIMFYNLKEYNTIGDYTANIEKTPIFFKVTGSSNIQTDLEQTQEPEQIMTENTQDEIYVTDPPEPMPPNLPDKTKNENNTILYVILFSLIGLIFVSIILLIIIIIIKKKSNQKLQIGEYLQPHQDYQTVPLQPSHLLPSELL